MVIEKVEIQVEASNSARFVDAMEEGLAILRSAKNAHSVELYNVVERPEVYFLLIQWASIDDHIEFTKTEPFGKIRNILGSFCSAKPIMEHLDIVAAS